MKRRPATRLNLSRETLRGLDMRGATFVPRVPAFTNDFGILCMSGLETCVNTVSVNNNHCCA